MFIRKYRIPLIVFAAVALICAGFYLFTRNGTGKPDYAAWDAVPPTDLFDVDAWVAYTQAYQPIINRNRAEIAALQAKSETPHTLNTLTAISQELERYENQQHARTEAWIERAKQEISANYVAWDAEPPPDTRNIGAWMAYIYAHQPMKDELDAEIVALQKAGHIIENQRLLVEKIDESQPLYEEKKRRVQEWAERANARLKQEASTDYTDWDVEPPANPADRERWTAYIHAYQPSIVKIRAEIDVIAEKRYNRETYEELAVKYEELNRYLVERLRRSNLSTSEYDVVLR